MLSTMEDGKIVRGLAGVPDEGPVLLVGNHMMVGCDAFPIISEFVREKHVMPRGLAHPELFLPKLDERYVTDPFVDAWGGHGALPATPRNMFKLFATKSYMGLYPGGVPEGLHRKGEAHRVFWPEKQEFVRMAARFGATIVPFGVVGEDDMMELIIDYDTVATTPILETVVRELNKKRTSRRQDGEETAIELSHFPVFLPRLPGRVYGLFGKPIRTKGMEKTLKDRENAQALYLQIKREVEKNISYLLEKRERDPYRGLVARVAHSATNPRSDQDPTFEP